LKRAEEIQKLQAKKLEEAKGNPGFKGVTKKTRDELASVTFKDAEVPAELCHYKRRLEALLGKLNKLVKEFNMRRNVWESCSLQSYFVTWLTVYGQS